MKVLVAGAAGQLGRELPATAPSGWSVLGYDVAIPAMSLDITDSDAVSEVAARLAPDAIINAAAYTAVDRAESEPERAYAVNARGAANLAAAARRFKSSFVQVSTDFVFDGRRSTPYPTDAEAGPLGVYGAGKLEGERRVLEELGASALVVRTAWLYSAGGENFVKTMLRLLAERDCVRVVADQVGTPTWARTLARAVWRALEIGLTGKHHWTDAGVASWYDFAVAVREEAFAAGLLARRTPVIPIRAADYPTPARRPAYSVLDKSKTWAAIGIAPLHWREALRMMLEELNEAHQSADQGG